MRSALTNPWLATRGLIARWSLACCLALGTACSAPVPTECSDGIDNDFDGLFDTADPDCATGTEFGAVRDYDNDRISDIDEDLANGRDTDGDGTPDYRDNDSDNDGLLDEIEAGDTDLLSPPFDSDGDGTPDFLDLDSDNNSIRDSNIGTEGTGDIDFDGIGNYADLDDDGDSLLDSYEIGGLGVPIDTDGDGKADFQDTDTDGDTIMDLHERMVNNDGDALPAYRDLDSDDDCIPDALEAGDTDPSTAPRDTNLDSVPDFLDIDSDGDYLVDGLEDLNCNGVLDPGESSPFLEDTDGDGIRDVVEYASGTDPADPDDNPQSNGDFVFEMPFMEQTMPAEDSLEFTTTVKFVDLYFSFDTTGSMTGELSAMSSPTNGVPAIIDALECASTGGACVADTDCSTGICFLGSCIEDPGDGNGCLPDLWTGVGRFDELDTFYNILAPQANATTTAGAIPGTGGGAYEAPYQAPACVADSANCQNASNCVGGADTCVGFRNDAIRILLQITDADDQCFGGGCSLYTPSFTGGELISKQIKFVGLYGTSDDSANPGTAQSVAEDIAIASNSIGFWGDPYVYPAEDSAVVAQTVNAVEEIFNGIDLDVTITAIDLPGDDGDALQFIDYLEVNTSGVGNCTSVPNTTDENGDSYHDTFPSLLAGTPVCWDVHPIQVNTTEDATVAPRMFRAELTVRGDGSVLDRRNVLFFVPPSLIILD